MSHTPETDLQRIARIFRAGIPVSGYDLGILIEEAEKNVAALKAVREFIECEALADCYCEPPDPSEVGVVKCLGCRARAVLAELGGAGKEE